MKKLFCLLLSVFLGLAATVNVFAAGGSVTYKGKAKGFVFAPGSDYSLTDMFSEYKGVMPGDTLTQKITLKNDAKKNIKVKVYMRSLGAHDDSVEFLSKLGMRIKKSNDNSMAYMFDAAASDTADLTEWNFLGTLYSGGEINLDVLLDVPKELDNKYSKQIGYLDWEFKIEEFPVEETDPDAPQTGDHITYILLSALTISSTCIIIFIIYGKKKRKEEPQD